MNKNEIVFVTHNTGKIKSAEKYFKNLKFTTFNYELDEPRSDDIKEIATAKVKEAYEIVKRPCIAYHDGENIHYFYGRHPGNLANKISGLNREEKWSDLWYIFKPFGFDKTLAEMDSEERENRRKIDGSVQAMQEFAKWYENQ